MYTSGSNDGEFPAPLHWEAPYLTIRNIREDEIRQVSSILADAALWLERSGRPMWREGQYSVEGLLSSYRKAQMYLGFIGAQAAATLILEVEDRLPWPNDAPAFYLHKLAVRRQYAGTGLAEAVIGWAKHQARVQGKRYLRLDCAADRPGLRAFYERQGFVCVRETLVLNKYPTALYESKIDK